MIIKVVAYFELLIALTLCSISIWLIIGLFTCPPDSHDCAGWSLIGLYITAPATVLIGAAGFWFLKSKKWWTQIIVIAALAWFISQAFFP